LFHWIKSDQTYLLRIFTKQSALNQIKKSVGLKYDSEYPIKEILDRLDILVDTLICYINGMPLNKINDMIPESGTVDGTTYLKKARNFVLKIVPELSFGFGIITMIMIEKAKQKGINKREIPMNIRVLASCIREGFDDSEKLYFKRNMKLLMRVETHEIYNQMKK
jgi:ATP-dependent RNA helicase DOB1